MKRKNPKYTHGFVDHDGKPRFYLRAPGRKRVPLPGLPWSPEFMEARSKALEGEWAVPLLGAKRTKAGTVNAALVSYYQSTAFTTLAESSQKMRRAILERFREEHGDKRIALLPRKALQAILNKKTPAAASNWRKALRGFIDHCLSLDMMTVDPLAGIKLVAIKSNGHHPWEPEECRQFEAHHAIGTRARLAFELMLQVGQSRCDVVRIGRQHVRNGKLALKRQKTGVAFEVPVMDALQDAIDAMPLAGGNLTFLITAQGKPFSAAGFGNWFRGVCNEAGLPRRCTSHGLRKAAATYLADRGATTTQLMAWFGWKTASEAERYTRGADRKRNAAAAGELVSGTGIGKPEIQFAKKAAKPLKTRKAKP